MSISSKDVKPIGLDDKGEPIYPKVVGLDAKGEPMYEDTSGILDKAKLAGGMAYDYLSKPVVENMPLAMGAVATGILPASAPYWAQGMMAGSAAGGTKSLQGGTPAQVIGEGLSSGLAGAVAPVVTKRIISPIGKALSPYLQKALSKVAPEFAENVFGTADAHALELAKEALNSETKDLSSRKIMDYGAELNRAGSKFLTDDINKYVNSLSSKIMYSNPANLAVMDMRSELENIGKQVIKDNVAQGLPAELTDLQKKQLDVVGTLLMNKLHQIKGAMTPSPFSNIIERGQRAFGQGVTNKVIQGLYNSVLNSGKDIKGSIQNQYNKGGK